MTNRASFYATRALIGLFEGGFIPGVILMATYFYTSKELSVRLAAFWSTLNIASKFSAPHTSLRGLSNGAEVQLNIDIGRDQG